MARLALILFCTFLAQEAACDALSSRVARKLNRFKQQCENGNGKACYDYGRSLWSSPGAINRDTSKKYLARACELKYRLACQSLAERRTKTVRQKQSESEYHSITKGECFSPVELGKAQFAPNPVSQFSVHGQVISIITPKSFWDRVGLHNFDIITKLNNMPVNTQQETLQAVASSPKEFRFEIERDRQPMTLLYNCE